MQKKQLEKLQRLLAEEKDELLKVEARLGGPDGLGEPLKEVITELSSYDNHPGDEGSQLYERSKDLGLLEITRTQLQEIEEAQKAIAEGSYGYCRNCGQRIPEQRLFAIPRTLFCVQCKREQEDRDLDDRPVEELVMYPPFGRTFTDETDNVVFDGEDAWEAVARYGTSSYVEKD